MKTKLIAAALVAALSFAAHAQEASTDHSQDIAWHNRQSAALAALKAEDGWRWLDGGIMFRRTRGTGEGFRPTVRDTVKVHYAGTLVDGTTFDSSFDRGEPVTFPLSRLIRAWQVAIPQMAVGDTIEIAAPAAMAYGPEGGGPIPGGATLFFKVELLGIPSNPDAP